jgi:hypothetical protein
MRYSPVSSVYAVFTYQRQISQWAADVSMFFIAK